MSKLTVRVALAVLISLVVIGAIYTTVLGASPWGIKAGEHVVSGAKVNLDHYRSLEPQSGGLNSQSDFLSPNGSGNGHGCESESRSNPSDL